MNHILIILSLVFILRHCVAQTTKDSLYVGEKISMEKLAPSTSDNPAGTATVNSRKADVCLLVS